MRELFERIHPSLRDYLYLLKELRPDFSVLTSNPNIGNIRETFFYNQMREKQDVISSRVSDFTIGDYTFEIGGRKKGKKQIEDVKNGRIVKDDIETGHGIIIPLWYFGMNY